MRVAVVGHVEWVDFVPVRRLPVPGEVVHADGAFTRAAGGGGVAAAVLAELGAEVDFYCALGRDAHGEAVVAELESRGVTPHVAWSSHPTRRAVTMLEDGGERTIVTIGERLDPPGSSELEWERLRGVDGVYFTAGDAAALVHAREARELVATPRARHALEGEGPMVDALVFSAGDRDESKWAARVAARARLLVVTDGPRGGSWFGESEGTWPAVPPPGRPRDAYGCGDSFAAAFTYALARGETVAGAAALGAKVGAEVLTRRGAP
ncbi:MAG TPA: PfkB family carbohydrate kinase [Solirubrobacteraceae bacterium]|jgi:ribokinase